MLGIGKNKRKRQEDGNLNGGDLRAREKIAKRILGKDSGRKVFGFACSPDIHAQIKMLAGELQVPMFALSEHLFQLSIGVISRAKENAEEREELRRHLVEIHVDQRTIEKFAWYDEELGKELNEKRFVQFEIDRAVRQIVVNFARKGMKPKYMAGYLDYGFACYAAAVNSRPFPTPSQASFLRKSQSPNYQPAGEKGNKAEDSGEQSAGNL
jgi:hypothetical protein